MQETVRAVTSVLQFELRRVLSASRIATWGVLVLFPVALIMASRGISQQPLAIEDASIAIYLLVPQIVCVLALLLWATSTVQAEIEGLTWIYIALRPFGRIATVAGKYVISVLFAASAGCVAAIGCSIASGSDQVAKLASTMCVLVVLSSLAYGAIYTLIGVVIYRRAMVFAFGYTIMVELILSLIPATVNKLTISYRLRGLLAHWLPLDFPPDVAEIFATTDSPTAHIAQLLIYIAVVLTLALTIVGRREYPTTNEA